MRSGFSLVLTCIAGIGVSVGFAYAGDPTPPAGPVAGTMKTLDEVEPRIPVGPDTTPGDANSVYRITAGGSYYLTGNVVASAGEHGVEIAASDVTLDLNGFHVTGNLTGALMGIHADGTVFSVEIKNGFIWGFEDGGIGSSAGQYVRSRVLDMRVTNTNGVGITLGSRSTIARCSLDVNAVGGILAGSSSIVSDCTSTNSAGVGIEVGIACAVTNCVSVANGEGIKTGDASEVVGCTARDNNGNGITVATDSIVRDSAASTNGGHGIEASTFSQVIDCNSNRNTLSGIRALNRTRVSGCSAGDNKEHGVHITYAGLVENCFLNHNDVNGIHMDDGGAVTMRHNTISESVIGIRIEVASGNRIEGNSVTACSARGISVLTAANVVIGNFCTGSPADFDVAAGNLFGPVETTATIGAATNPHANYEF